MEPYEAREIVAQAWCDNSTSHLDMIPELAEAFAKILVEEVGRAMLAAAPTQPVSEARWLPIETAPKDGTKFLAWRRYSTLPLIVHYDDEYSQWEDADGIFIYELTHWMRLPKAPAMQEDKP